MIDKIIYSTKPNMQEVPGGWDNESPIQLNGTNNVTPKTVMDGMVVVDKFLSDEDCEKIIAFMASAPHLEPVSVQGNPNVHDNRIGSIRATTWSTTLAVQLWDLYEKYGMNKVRSMTDKSLTDWWQHGENKLWKPVAISPMLRFMKYRTGGQHYAHYDAAYFYPDTDYRSLMSVVIYLTTNETGRTRFVNDGQTAHVKDRNHEDWTQETKDEQVQVRVKPTRGRVLFFDHRMCHDVERYDGKEGDRIIIRGDVVFKKV